ncbi:Crossover junction endonuclease mus81 [Tulasnella sp. 330]|nr:Crossover junction endonuclease mus81 [Tulasnella sp. 330]
MTAGPSGRAPSKKKSSASTSANPTQSRPKAKKKSSRASKRSRQDDSDDGAEDFSAAMDAIAGGSQRPAAKRRATGEAVIDYNEHPDAALWAHYGVPIPGTSLVHPERPAAPVPHQQHHYTAAAAPGAQGPASPGLQGLSGFEFWYLDDQNRHVRKCNDAFIDLEHVRWKIEYLRSQSHHPWATQNIKQQREGTSDTYYGFLDQAQAEMITDCPGFERPPPVASGAKKAAPISRESTAGGAANAALQASLAQAEKRTVGSINPSRQASRHVLDALNGTNLRHLGRIPAASIPGSTSESFLLRDDVITEAGKSDAQIRRDRMAQAALRRLAGLPTVATESGLHVYDTRSPSPALPQPPSVLSRTASAPVAPVMEMPPARAPVGPNATQPQINVIAAKDKARRPRVSNHQPPPHAIDDLANDLEDPQQRFNGRSSPVNLSNSDDEGGGRAELERISVYKTDRKAQEGYQQPFDPHVLRAGTYDIKLIIDNREVQSSKNKATRDAFWQALENKGISVEQRPLVIGDVTWVATKKYADATGGPQECVLDFVLERKRLDDLISSVMDGRFHEQKFRLKQTGIGRVYYLIEHHNTKEKREKWNQQIDTALSSTQVVDGFLVKETKNFKETIEYLTVMHQTIVRMHRDRDLFIIPDAQIRRHSYTALQAYLRETQPERIYHTTYDTFRALNDKSGQETLKNCWARMLLCVTGFSAEKVAKMLEIYDTPKALWDAFREAELVEEEEREREEAEQGKGKGRQKKSKAPLAKHLLTRVTADVSGRKKIGPALSEKLYNVFRAEVYAAD